MNQILLDPKFTLSYSKFKIKSTKVSYTYIINVLYLELAILLNELFKIGFYKYLVMTQIKTTYVIQ